MRSQIEPELINLLGEDGYRQLAEAFGGTRIYVPAKSDISRLTETLDHETVDRLAGRYGGDYLAVPLARDFLARHYRTLGLANVEIARKLRISESAVIKLFKRTHVARPRKVDPRQIDLF